MMYDFDTVVERRDTDSLKWNVAEGELPMWVADMDFPAAPEILAELRDRVGHGVFGYAVLPDRWYEAICGWWEKRHGLRIEREWLGFCTGIVPAVYSIVRSLTKPGEKVLLQTPVYNAFFGAIRDNGREVAENRLLYDGISYMVDWADLEAKLSDPAVTLFILCNPHNPVGKLWDRETLARLGELCRQNGVTVIADEIHCDLTDPGRDYVPFASVSEICRDISVTCIAPTKTFNLAGLQTAAVFVSDPALREKVLGGLHVDGVSGPGALAVTAAIAAFEKGAPWLDELRTYLYDNKRLFRRFVGERLPKLAVVPSEATYLLWVDCGDLCRDAGAFAQFLRAKTGLFVTAGVIYGEAGRQFLRVNIACPRTALEDGLTRLETGVRLYEEAVRAGCED